VWVRGLCMGYNRRSVVAGRPDAGESACFIHELPSDAAGKGEHG